jgi:ABC-2 type transport system permease protein
VRVARAELLKLRTTRVVYVLAGLALLFSGLAAAIVAAEEALDDDPALGLAEIAGTSGFLALVLGVLLTTNEYRHGTITSTFLVTPRRPHVLVAKLVAGGLAGGVLGVTVAAISFGIAIPWLNGSANEIPIDGQFLEAAGRLVALYALFVLIGVAAGAIVQNQAGTIVAAFAWLFVVEQILNVIAAVVAEGDSPIASYLPGGALAGVSATEGDRLEGGWALLLSCGYVGLLSAAGALAMTRRDPV